MLGDRGEAVGGKSGGREEEEVVVVLVEEGRRGPLSFRCGVVGCCCSV
jgi:hypothetical protein